MPNQTYNNLADFTTNVVTAGVTISATETFETYNGFYASGLSGNFGAGTPTWTASAPGGLYCGAAGGSQVLSTNNPVPLTLTFNPGVTALSANIFGTDASFAIIPATITVTFANGSTTSFSTTSASDFFGTTANSALITSISISAIDNAPGDVFVTVDNLVIATGTLNSYTHISYNDLSNFSAAAVTAGVTISATETFETYNGFYASGLSGNFGAGTPTWTASAPGGLYCGAAGGSQVLSTNNPVPLTLTFNPGVTALSANIFGTDPSFAIIPATITATFANGDTYIFSTTSANDFYGVIGYSSLITSITISAIDNAPGDVFVTVDNLVIATGTINSPLACYQSYVFNNNTCAWDVTGTQPAEPTTALACYQTRAFDTGSCSWVTSGTQPAQPTLACYETATFNTTSCVWDVTATGGSTTYFADVDADGFGDASTSIQGYTCLGTPAGYVTNNLDCDDTLSTTYPGAAEICYDGIDQNCDGDLMNGCVVITARLRAENCDTNLTSLNQVVRGNRFSQSIPSGVTVTGYRFRVTNLLTNEVRIVDRSNFIFQLTYTDFADYDTPYSVEVAVRLNQQWMEAYGAPCTITTPGVTNTVLASTSCGATVAQMNNIIRAVVVPSATSYEFEVSLIEGNVAVQTTTLVRTGESFNLLQLTGISIKYGAQYRVRVKVQVPTSSGPQWSTEYGAACSVFTPLAPEPSIQGCGAETGIAPSALSTIIYASPVGGATQYRFTLTDGMAYTRTYTTPSRYFRLSNFNALQALTLGGTYSVTVEVQVYGFYYPGKDCNILVPFGNQIGRELTKDEDAIANPMGEFKAVAYPNPYGESFALNLISSSTSPVSLAIYDMAGRLLETREFNVEKLASQKLGERYPSGVYSVVVNQDEENQTIRVVKK
jgi:hypothetical protein